MFCPQCGVKQSEELKFCKLCGANLHAVRQVVGLRETDERFDWSKTWVAEMFLSETERKKRAREQKILKHELEHRRGLTPEVRRYQEIKAGVIVSCVGLGAAIFLFFFMQGVILSSGNADAAEILSRVWIAGVIPFLIGVGMMINGLVVSKKIVEARRRDAPADFNPATAGSVGEGAQPHFLGAADTTEFVAPGFSVTEDKTKQLSNSGPGQ
ncbi:MAG TPA: zinc ribbon domain-containing protein [Pyrinomonadaceae bacterium]|nr:zinc ribbon domain-containing protein [Pyrinomonadaceae bacterium]